MINRCTGATRHQFWGLLQARKSRRGPPATAAGPGAVMSPSITPEHFGRAVAAAPPQVSPVPDAGPAHPASPAWAPLAAGAWGSRSAGSPMALPNILLPGESIVTDFHG
ncbi:unnamed protein product [Coccothraustes coccothraustes]